MKNPAPKVTFSRNYIKHNFNKNKTFIFRKNKKKAQGYPPAIARWVGGADPGPNLNEIGQILTRLVKYGPK